jgi:hypothetical protein
MEMGMVYPGALAMNRLGLLDRQEAIFEKKTVAEQEEGAFQISPSGHDHQT